MARARPTLERGAGLRQGSRNLGTRPDLPEQEFKQKHGMVYGDVLVTDPANKVDDWVLDQDDGGCYQPGGASQDDFTKFICTGVDGTLYK